MRAELVQAEARLLVLETELAEIERLVTEARQAGRDALARSIAGSRLEPMIHAVGEARRLVADLTTPGPEPGRLGGSRPIRFRPGSSRTQRPA